jgi:hypothetical protein
MYPIGEESQPEDRRFSAGHGQTEGFVVPQTLAVQEGQTQGEAEESQHQNCSISLQLLVLYLSGLRFFSLAHVCFFTAHCTTRFVQRQSL